MSPSDSIPRAGDRQSIPLETLRRNDDHEAYDVQDNSRLRPRFSFSNDHDPFSYGRKQDEETLDKDGSHMSAANASDFQAAMGGVGSFGLELDSSPSPPLQHGQYPASSRQHGFSSLGPPLESPSLEMQMPRFLYTTTTNGSSPELQEQHTNQDNDQTPLTDHRYLAPISGAQSSAHLGDDIAQAEAGHGIKRPKSNLSAQSNMPPGAISPLSRAGTIMRNASQRVVNLSNDPDLVDESLREQRRSQDDRQSRLQEPPDLPAMHDYAHDDQGSHRKFPEKTYTSYLGKGSAEEPVTAMPNPLRGKTLGIFGPTNRLRLWLCDMLVHPFTEPAILILIIIQTIILTVEAAPTVALGQRPGPWQHVWSHFALLALFILFTIEILARVIVSGFMRNAAEYSTVDNSLTNIAKLRERVGHFFMGGQALTQSLKDTSFQETNPSVLRTFTNVQRSESTNPLQRQRFRLAQRAFLRHGFNRLDFVAVVSYWIYFVLSLLMIVSHKHIYLFKMLSCLRIVRLLGLTRGTSVILRSLKKAAPSLVNVAFLISFFWLLFAIIGVQSFKSSLRRTCVWYEQLDVTLKEASAGLPLTTFNYSQNTAPGNIQFCGGYIDSATHTPRPWLKPDLLTIGATRHKGFLCPAGSLCVEGGNPYLGTVSFDNILQSLQLVFVIMSANTFSDILYYTTNSDLLAAALFFAFGIVVMSFWLMNLLVAVITSSFQVIREESKASAFTMDEDDHVGMHHPEISSNTPRLMRYYERTYWLWILIILYDLFIMCLRSADMGFQRRALIDRSEVVVTFILLLEIIFRFTADWRDFYRSKRNWVDLGLAVITTIILIPPIRGSGEPYQWLTVFQILRIYRVVLAIPSTRDLLLKVLGNVSGLLNLIIFVFLVTFLIAIFAVQIFRGDFPDTDSSGNPVRITFSNIYNSFIGMYQVLSSENWTILMYNSTQYDLPWHTSWIGATFFILWFILANFIVVNMFIAVIQENFDISEDEKRLQQVKAFLQQKELGGLTNGNLSLSTIFKFGRSKFRQRDPLEYGPATLDMLLQETIFRDFLDEHMDTDSDRPRTASSNHQAGMKSSRTNFVQMIRRYISNFMAQREPNPFYAKNQPVKTTEETNIRTQAKEIVSAADARRKAQRQYLQRYPRYNVSLFIFRPDSRIRRFCQSIVGPGHGYQRIEGVNPVKPIWYTFSAFIYAAIVAMVLLACVSTPLYQREYFKMHGGYTVRNWFVWTDMGFAVVFTLEAMIKIIADGFFWTPNAYFRGTWGFIDGIVLVTLWIDVITSLYKDGAVSRAVGAFKALRALRLLNVSDSARNTFHSVIILGGWKVISAAFVSLSLLLPFAVYGVNLFNGKMRSCNDSNVTSLSDCAGEFAGSPFYWNVLSPRRAANPFYNFDNFGNSLSILFQIVSQEGWTDVMWTAMSITGFNEGTSPLSSPGNAIFFIIFNLLGAVFVLTLFVSVFMRNYTEQTGVAFLTTDQRSWLELRKLLRQISPSKRPSNEADLGWKAWCYKVAVKKHGRWQRFLTTVLCLHLILLVLEFYPEPRWWERLRDYLFLVFTLIYLANIVIRLVGLSWKRFRKSSWDLYSVMAVSGTIATTLLDLSQYNNALYAQLHKFFLVSITLLLIPRNNQLDQLFKTAAASLPAIANLLATWFVLFLVYAIALTQTFGLTRFGNQENGNLNFRTVPKALILLFRMSIGEGWNQIMEDFATITYPNCVIGPEFFDSDCGSATWARLLFISWNILSMYIFVSLFVSLIFESFSYVYQRSGGIAVINREEIRRFKQAWAIYDPEGTGYISRALFPRLLGELSGVFEMRIYSGGDHSVHRILENCKVEAGTGRASSRGVVHGVDLAELNRQLRMIDVHDIRRRRSRMEIFYQEIMVSADSARGISFTSCLMILAHYNVITDSKALRLEEFLRRRARLQRVEEEVRRRVVKGFFDMMFWSRQFRSGTSYRNPARLVDIPQFTIPEIFVDDEEGDLAPEDDLIRDQPNTRNEPSSEFQRPSVQSFDDDTTQLRQELAMRLSGQSGASSGIELSPQTSPRLGTRSPAPRSPTLRSENSGSPTRDESFDWDGVCHNSMDGANETAFTTNLSPHDGRSRATSSAERSNVLEVFDNSAWGASMRRSFTERRSGTRSHSQNRG